MSETIEWSKLSPREQDAVVAEKVFGLERRSVRPYWYNREVLCLHDPANGLMTYSYDSNGCNAIMFRNGQDSTMGTADPLPFFTTKWEHVENVAREILVATDSPADLASVIEAICIAALRAKGYEVVT